MSAMTRAGIICHVLARCFQIIKQSIYSGKIHLFLLFYQINDKLKIQKRTHFLLHHDQKYIENYIHLLKIS